MNSVRLCSSIRTGESNDLASHSPYDANVQPVPSLCFCLQPTVMQLCLVELNPLTKGQLLVFPEEPQTFPVKRVSFYKLIIFIKHLSDYSNETQTHAGAFLILSFSNSSFSCDLPPRGRPLQPGRSAKKHPHPPSLSWWINLCCCVRSLDFTRWS